MPIFEYLCPNCGTKFEKIVSSGAVVVACKNCGSPHVKKLLSVFAVSEGTRSTTPSEAGPCGACGAAQRGMCDAWRQL